MDQSKIEELLTEFDHVPRAAPPTFLEVCGYPHYENVASNVLEFYFSAEREHKLKALVLSSLLSAVGKDISDRELSDASASREEPTDSRKRLDLLIECGDMLVGVENKIGAPVANPFREYSKMLESRAKGRNVIKILLTLNKIEDGRDLDGFKPVTYGKFFDAVLQRLGQRLTTADAQWLGYLIDFIKTIQNLSRGSSMSPEFLDFVRRRNEDIAKFQDHLKEFRMEIERKLSALSEAVNPKGPGLEERFRIKGQFGGMGLNERLARVLTCEVESVDGFNIRIATELDAHGFKFDFFWPNSAQQPPDLKTFLGGRGIATLPCPNGVEARRDARSFPYNEDILVVAEKLKSLISKIVQ